MCCKLGDNQTTSFSVITMLTVSLIAATTEARTVRRLFEPTDLELESAGTAELDVQFGAIRGPDAFRLSVPDFELDLGITDSIELDLDGALACVGPSDGSMRYDHLESDNLWLAVKAGLLSWNDPTKERVVSTGLQIGPKLPTASHSRGIGLESLAIVGVGIHRTHVIFNLGALIDPSPSNSSRPCGYEAGVDFDRDLDAAGRWSLLAEFGTVQFTSPDNNQLHTTFGIAWSPSDLLTLSAVGLTGLLHASDRYGVLIGISPKVRLWGQAKH